MAATKAEEPSTEGFGSDGDDAMEKYRLTTEHSYTKPEKRQHSEDAAFQKWVASFAKERLPLGDDPKDTLGETTPLIPRPDMESDKIITTPRQYQIDLFERAKKENTIVVLDTGSGKTLIAALLLRHTLSAELEHREQGNPPKTAFFLVDKVVLCMQQYNVLRQNLEYPVGKLHGSNAATGLKREDWDAIMSENMVIVCTAQILLDGLTCGFVTMSRINLLVFDEAHHTKKSHPYAKIVRDYYIRTKTDRPRILGMTASPVDSKTNDLQAAALELETTLHSRIATVPDEELMREMGKRQQLERVVYYGRLLKPEDARTQLWHTLCAVFAGRPEFMVHLEAAQDIASSIGPGCADEYWTTNFMRSNSGAMQVAMNDAIHWEQDIDAELYLAKMTDSDVDSNLFCEQDHIYAAIRQARKSIREYMEIQPPLAVSTDRFSTKFLALRDILSDAFSTNSSRRSIVFVQKRYTALVLSTAFQQAPILVPNMFPGYVVGSQTMSSSIANMSIKEQFNTMHRFRRGEINCLFATQVAEEGIDIPDCDLIVRFDLYDSPIQYIQSKGRARRANSTYISMLEENNMQHFRRLKEATLNASALRRFVSVLSQDRKVTDQDLDTDQRAQDMELESKSQRIFKIPETEAQMTYYSSQQVLAKFVSSLPDGDGLHPEYIVTPTYKGSNYIATLILPDSSPVKTLRGTPQRSKTLARASAAFEACIDMFYRGYIDGHLQSTLKKRLPAMRNARLGLSSSKRSEYTMRLKPDVWSQTGAPAELYVAVFTMDGSALPGKTGRSLLVLTRSKLPALAPITLHVGTTERRTVKPVQYDQSTAVEASEVALIAGFTFTIFKDVFSKEFDCKGENLPYYFAPCSNRDASDVKVDTRRLIDWALLESMAQVNETMPTPGWQITDELAHKFVYDPLDGSRKFITGAVNEHLRPSDRVPAGAPPPKSRGFFRVAGTIADYSNSLSFNARRRVTWDPEQPVYHAELLPIRRNLLCQPEDDETAGCKSCSIILEPMVVSALPIDVVATAMALPVIMYKVESVAISMDACRLLDLEMQPSLALEALTKDSLNTEQHGEEQINFQRGMGDNYERLEFLGDTFLKMATTISLFTLMPNDGEFECHVERMLMVCNKNLFNHAVDRKLQEYIRSKGFNRRTWYPDLPLKKGKALKSKATHSLADKSIADVCEALIGAAYMCDSDGSMDLAVRAVTKMVRSKNHDMSRFSDYYDRYAVPQWQTAPTTAAERFAAGKVHKSTGYMFNSPRLLRSAFKHPSYTYEPQLPHYQRLEFLGDALLDLVAVDYLFKQFPGADPQWLTEHKMCMVSNNFFGCLCVELGLHKHVLTTAAAMAGQMARFVEELRRAEEASAEDGDGRRPRADWWWVNVAQPPKFLSDVLEAFVGAMFVDSKYNYKVVRGFFNDFIAPHFTSMTMHDSFVAGHPVTLLTKRMQDVFGCRSWRLCVKNVPCGSETGARALTDDAVMCALMVHGKPVAHCVGGNGRDAKADVATRGLELLAMDREAFRAQQGCDCGEQGAEKVGAS